MLSFEFSDSWRYYCYQNQAHALFTACPFETAPSKPLHLKDLFQHRKL